MVAQNVFHRASSHQTINLWRFAIRCNIPWNLPSRGTFLSSAHCSFRNTFSLRSVWWRRAMIPRESFTGFPKFQGIVSLNDFCIPLGLQELLQASLGFLWSFCLARICLDPLGGQVLQNDCKSVIVSRFTIVTEDLVICCYQVTKIFSTRYGSTIASSARGPCNFGPLADTHSFRSTCSLVTGLPVLMSHSRLTQSRLV